MAAAALTLLLAHMFHAAIQIPILALCGAVAALCVSSAAVRAMRPLSLAASLCALPSVLAAAYSVALYYAVAMLNP